MGGKKSSSAMKSLTPGAMVRMWVKTREKFKALAEERGIRMTEAFDQAADILAASSRKKGG